MVSFDRLWNSMKFYDNHYQNKIFRTRVEVMIHIRSTISHRFLCRGNNRI
jgi:hypothetical protein